MKTEISCGNCGAVWHLEAKTGAGEMLCPVCLWRIELGEPAASAAAAPPAAAAAAPPTAAAESTLPEEVVCPRCKLHFSPFSKRSRANRATSGRRKCVLVIEDQKYFREVAADALKVAFDVKTASGANEAEATLAAGGIDLIVLDLTLDGEDSGRRLLMRLRPKPCPVVIFTAQDESELYGDPWEELARLGADDLVIKGMNVGESLLRKAASLLGTPLEDLEQAKPIG